MQRLLAVALLLVACQPSEPIREPRIPDRGTRMKVGLLTPGSVNDNGWNGAEFEEGFRSYGAKGFDLAFGHGFEFQDAALKAGWAGKKESFPWCGMSV